jgi:NAD-dependent DNA ligase
MVFSALFIVTAVIFLSPLGACAKRMRSISFGRRAAFHVSSSYHGRRISGTRPASVLSDRWNSSPHFLDVPLCRRMTAQSSSTNVLDSSATGLEEEKIYLELTRLTTEIQQHDHLYYTPGLSPLLSDDEYDALTEREAELCKRYPGLLKKLEVESGLGSKVSRFGGRVGPIIEENGEPEAISRKKLAHLENAPMQSLDNAMISPQVVKWIDWVRKNLFKTMEEGQTETKIIQIIAEPKMDGLSLSLRYTLRDESKRLYELEWGATRGDGTRGEDVTEAVSAIEMIPKTFVYDSDTGGLPEIIEVRGEVVLPTSKFVELTAFSDEVTNSTSDSDNNSGGGMEEEPANSGPLIPKQFSNARNAASGILLRRKPKSADEIENTKVLRSYLRFYSYSIAFSSAGTEREGDETHYSDGIEMRNLLNSIGFKVPNPFEIATITLKEDEEFAESECEALFDYHSSVMSSRDNSSEECDSAYNFDFDVDGAVYKVSSVNDRFALGKICRAWQFQLKNPTTNSSPSYFHE